MKKEISDFCLECIRKHINKKGEFKVKCNFVPKELMDAKNPVYPTERLMTKDVYEKLDDKSLVDIQLSKNKLLWAKEFLGWTTYNADRDFDQFYQREMLNCTAKLRTMRLGRRMGKCLHPETLIRTKNRGKVKLEDLKSDDIVYSYNEKKETIEETSDFFISDNGTKDTYVVKTKSGKKDLASFNHPYLIKKGTFREWVDAENLKPNDICFIVDENLNIIEDEIESIEYLGVKKSLNISVYPNRTIITDDIITHNTEVVTIDALHYAQNNPGKNVMIIGPFQNLIDEIFDRISSLLDSPMSAFGDGYERKRQPNVIRLPNGSQIKGFTTGLNGDSIRGQSADRIYFDEAAYIPPTAFRSVLALLMDNPNVSITATSTPSALETKFKQWCNTDPDWKEFHFQSTLFPYFHEIEATLRSTYTGDDFALEVLAEFIEGSSRVFKSHNVQSALDEYKYVNSFSETGLNRSDWVITVGVDYNEWANGVQIVVLGFDKSGKSERPFKVFNRISLHNETYGESKNKNLQSKGVETIKDMYHNFNADYVYVDQGHGSMQNEVLSEYFFKIGKPHVFKGVDFSSNYEYEDIYTGEIKHKRKKVMMVYFLQKRFELGEIKISKNEESEKGMLISQLNEFRVDRYDSKDQPIFAGLDHILDGLMLANFAMVENFSTLFDRKTGLYVGAIKRDNSNSFVLQEEEFNNDKLKNTVNAIEANRVKNEDLLKNILSSLNVMSVPNKRKRSAFNEFEFF